MGTFNFHPDHNTPHKAVFCRWEDHDKYKEDMINEYGEEEASTMCGCSDSDYAYSEWCDMEEEFYMEQLHEDLKQAFGRDIDVDGEAHDGEEVCRVGNTFNFAGMNFEVVVGIFLESGYYEGFALDWEIIKLPDYYGDSVPTLNEAEWYLRDGLNPGLAKALAPKFIKRCEKELKEITDKLDTILMNLAPHNMEIGWGCSEYKESA